MAVPRMRQFLSTFLLVAFSIWGPVGANQATPEGAARVVPTHPRTRIALESVLRSAGLAVKAGVGDVTWTKADSTLGAANRLAAQLGLEPPTDPFPSADTNARLNTFGGGVTLWVELMGSTLAKAGSNADVPVKLTVSWPWRRLPTPYTLFQPPAKPCFAEYKKIFLDLGCTTVDGQYYKKANITATQLQMLIARIKPGEPEYAPCMPPGEAYVTYRGSGYSFSVDLVDAGKHPVAAGEKVQWPLVVSLDPVPADWVPAEAPDAPAPTCESATAVLQELNFKEVQPGEFELEHVSGFEYSLAHQAIRAGELKEQSHPPEGQAGVFVSRADNPTLGVELETQRLQYNVPHKPDSWIFDRVTIRFKSTGVAPNAPIAPNAPSGKAKPKP